MKVSVLITCYRRREYLARAIASVLRSSAPSTEREVVVVADAVEPTLAAEWRRQGIDLVVADLPIVGEMLRAGLERCHGDAVSFLDDDDLFVPAKLGVVRDAFAADPELVLFRSGFDPIDSAGAPVPSLRRTLPQPSRAYQIDTRTVGPGQRAWIARNRAYGNLSTMSVRRSALLARADDLVRVEAATDGSIATLMLDTGGHHRFDPRHLLQRRVGTSQRSLGKSGEASRAVRTFEYLSTRVRGPAAHWYVQLMLSWAKVDDFLHSRDGRLSLDDWAAYVRYHLPRIDAATWEVEAWSLARMVAPRRARDAYARRHHLSP
jgi:hypothetical protein